MTQPLYLTGARIWDGMQWREGPLAIAHGRIVSEALPHARRVDLSGWTIFPAWVNAHDHLELNHYPRTKPRDTYTNAHDWGEDVNALLPEEPFRSLRRLPLRERLFVGGLKNLLSGALTVVQHGPAHRQLFRRAFPVHVFAPYGWAHSLHFETPIETQRRLAMTRPGTPWFIHLAEGTDSTAANEYTKLQAIGGVSERTIIVHGIGLSPADRQHARDNLRGIVTCPSTNRYLLNAVLPEAEAWGVRLALGSDSRLTADGDLLSEMQAARREGLFSTEEALLRSVTGHAARLIGLRDVGHIHPGAAADLIITRSWRKRAELGAVIRAGQAQIGNPDLLNSLGAEDMVSCTLDGREKQISRRLARRLQQSKLEEPGLVLNTRRPRRRITLLSF